MKIDADEPEKDFALKMGIGKDLEEDMYILKKSTKKKKKRKYSTVSSSDSSDINDKDHNNKKYYDDFLKNIFKDEASNKQHIKTHHQQTYPKTPGGRKSKHSFHQSSPNIYKKNTQQLKVKNNLTSDRNISSPLPFAKRNSQKKNKITLGGDSAQNKVVKNDNDKVPTKRSSHLLMSANLTVSNDKEKFPVNACRTNAAGGNFPLVLGEPSEELPVQIIKSEKKINVYNPVKTKHFNLEDVPKPCKAESKVKVVPPNIGIITENQNKSDSPGNTSVVNEAEKNNTKKKVKKKKLLFCIPFCFQCQAGN